MIAPEPRFIVKEGIYPGALEERWQMEGYRAKAWRGWDASKETWTFVWISERGHFQVWNERKVGEHWYMFKTFVVEDEEVLSRQAFIPRADGSVIRTSEHSRDGGESWTLRFEERSRTLVLFDGSVGGSGHIGARCLKTPSAHSAEPPGVRTPSTV